MSYRNPPWSTTAGYFAVPNPMAAASGANITNLNATQVTSGNVPAARMDADVLVSTGGFTGLRSIASAGGTTQNVTVTGGQITDWTVV